MSSSGELQTELRGMELAGFQLLRTAVREGEPGGRSLAACVEAVAKAASTDGTTIVASAAGLPEAKNFSLRAGDGLQALRDISEFARAPLVIGDRTIRIGAVVGTGAPLRFTAADDIVALDHVQEDPEDLVPHPPPTGDGGGPAAAAAALAGVSLPKVPVKARTSVELTVLGDPAVRPGRPAVLVPDDPRDALPGPLRVERVRHLFDSRRGYTCEVMLVAAEPGSKAVRTTGAEGVAQRMRDIAESVRGERPAIDVGEVARYKDGRTGLAPGEPPLRADTGRGGRRAQHRGGGRSHPAVARPPDGLALRLPPLRPDGARAARHAGRTRTQQGTGQRRRRHGFPLAGEARVLAAEEQGGGLVALPAHRTRRQGPAGGQGGQRPHRRRRQARAPGEGPARHRRGEAPSRRRRASGRPRRPRRQARRRA
ncbi:hypothetical protein ACFSTC_03365 [Nonomuraea ferruginea]